MFVENAHELTLGVVSAFNLGTNGLPKGFNLYWNHDLIYFEIRRHGKRVYAGSTGTDDIEKALEVRAAKLEAIIKADEVLRF